MSQDRYLVTARKYRPQTFSELVSQTHVSDTLRNAIRLDRLAHAYLFSGPRGVGKTTAARILAKAINCTTPLADRPTTEPCRQCDSCQSFEEGRSLNIIEIDAASNNSVEDVRALREKVRIPPQGALKKVYIIDEVHMLSNAAFNALLKTLEEPPDHVLFIFATTEPHKVLPTILSRCQRFDFRRITVQEIVARLQLICKAEDVTADEGSLMLIARKGDGALRDALSVFDQSVSLCGTSLMYDTLARALGVVENDLFFDLTQRIGSQDRAGLLQQVNTMMLRGLDLHEVLGGLAEHIRNLLVAVTMGSTELIEADEATKARYVEHAGQFQETDLLRLLMILSDTEEVIKNSTQPRLKFELALLKMASMAHSADLSQLLKQLDGMDLEAIAASSPPVPSATPPPVKSALPPPPVVEEAYSPPVVENEQAPLPEEAYLPPPTPPQPTPSEAPPAVAPSVSPQPSEGGSLSLFGPPALKTKPAPRKAPENTLVQADTVAPAYDGAAAVATQVAPAIDFHFGFSLHKIRGVWGQYVKHVSQERIHVGALLQHTHPAGIERDGLYIAVPDAFHQRLLRSERDYLQKHLASLLEKPDFPDLHFTIQAGEKEEPEPETQAEIDPFERMKRLRQDNPVIRALFDQFGGELVW